MASSLDFQRIYDRYQEEGVPHNVSIVDFCQRNGIVYKHFERWLKNRRNVTIHPVTLTDLSAPITSSDASKVSDNKEDVSNDISKGLSDGSVMFSIKIVTNTGMLLQHRNLDYDQLHSLIDKLKVLC